MTRYSIRFTTKLTGKGTGLGLSICYGIIDVHNGRIEAHSEGAGKGRYLYDNTTVGDLVVVKIQMGFSATFSG